MATTAIILVLATLVLLATLIASGAWFADALAPRSSTRPGKALPVRADETALDRAVAPLLARAPGRSGAVLIETGRDAFGARALSARRAGRSLDLQYYAWKADHVGRMLGAEILAAAERGVRVRILLDDINHTGHDPVLLALNAHPNIEIRIHNPLRARAGAWRVVEMIQRVQALNHRMHNKCWIADGRVAIVGGRNIGAEYFDANKERNFRDLDLMAIGPAVDDATRAFDAYWNCGGVIPIEELSAQTPMGDNALRDLFEAARTETAARGDLDDLDKSPKLALFRDAGGEPAFAPHWCDELDIVADPPQKWRERPGPRWLVFQLTARIRAARSEALLVSPYFVPRRRLVRELKRAVRRGAKVGVVTNTLAATDVLAVHGGYMRYRRRLLRRGVEIYEMRAGAAADREGQGVFGSSGASLHTKAFVVDGETGFVGSYNLDPRSARLNTEMGALFRSRPLAAELRAYWEALASPRMSYAVERGPGGALRWRDGAVTPPVLLEVEPQSTLRQRVVAMVCRYLPIQAVL